MIRSCRSAAGSCHHGGSRRPSGVPWCAMTGNPAGEPSSSTGMRPFVSVATGADANEGVEAPGTRASRITPMPSPVRIDLRDDAADLEPLVSALRAGQLAILPTDTVYGLAAAAHLPDVCARVAHLKGRDPRQPTALICGSVETLLATVLPELHGRAGLRA